MKVHKLFQNFTHRLIYNCEYYFYTVSVPSCSGSYNITSNLQSFFTLEEVVCFTCSLPGGVPVRSWTINGTSAVGLPGVTVLYNGTLLVADPLGLLLSPTNSLPIQCFDQTLSVTYAAYMKFNGEYGRNFWVIFKI